MYKYLVYTIIHSTRQTHSGRNVATVHCSLVIVTAFLFKSTSGIMASSWQKFNIR